MWECGREVIRFLTNWFKMPKAISLSYIKCNKESSLKPCSSFTNCQLLSANWNILMWNLSVVSCLFASLTSLSLCRDLVQVALAWDFCHLPSNCTKLGCLISFITEASFKNSSTSIVSSCNRREQRDETEPQKVRVRKWSTWKGWVEPAGLMTVNLQSCLLPNQATNSSRQGVSGGSGSPGFRPRVLHITSLLKTFN